MRRVFSIVGICVLMSYGSPAVADPLSSLRVKGLRCESGVVPTGVGVQQPRLGWVLESGDQRLRDQVQTGWQILVASSPVLLSEAKADCWNSGRQKGSTNNDVVYAGKPLRSGAVYYWKVRAWDGQGKLSAWSEMSRWGMGLLSEEDWQGAAWVRDSRPALTDEALLYGDNPAPLFRKDLTVGAGVRRAVLYISGLGYYEARLNGRKVGDHYLDPGWTDYRKTVYYNSYDVTAEIKTGSNCLGVELGNGWYNSLPLRMWGGLNMRQFMATGQPQFIAKLVIEYGDGRRQEQVSDGSWKVTDGPWRRNNNYIGSVYDGRYVIPGWDIPGFTARDWRSVATGPGPGGALVAQEQPPVRLRASIKPVSIRQIGAGKYVVDMGRNFGGIVKMHVKGPKGTRIVLRYGELLYKDGSLNVMTGVAGQIKQEGEGGPGSPAVAWQQDECVLGDKEEWFQPAYTYHGFRYIEVSGYPGVLTAEKITGIALAADVQPAGSFVCSDSLFNTIQKVSVNTFLSNLFSVQSDCPHREKLGYGGDIVATSEAMMANFDMRSFYAKTVRDYADGAQPDGALPETAPFVGISDGGVTKTAAPIGWGTVLPLLLWQQYQYYGDRELVARYFPAAKGWVDFLHAHAPDHIISQGIGDHESLDPKQLEVTSTAFLYYNTKLLGMLAKLLGKDEEAGHYATLADEVRSAFRAKFLNKATGEIGIHTQATQAFAIYFGLVSGDELEKAMQVLLQQVKEKKEHVSTGIFGTKYLLEVLSKYGYGELACKLVGQKDFPGWGYMLANGATTLWEHWEYSDNTFSHNHPMFGSVSGWYQQYLAGIRPDSDAVGYNRIVLQPGGVRRLGSASASYRSPQGLIAVSWRVAGDSMYYDATVPVNSSATIILPASQAEDVREGGMPLETRGIRVDGLRQDGVVCHAGSGHYRFALALAGTRKTYALIPYPSKLTESGGEFVIGRNTKIVREAPGQLFGEERKYLQGMLGKYFKTAGFGAGAAAGNRLLLRYDEKIKEAEGYTLAVNGQQLVLTAGTAAGMFYAIGTLRQLLPADVEDGHGVSLRVPGLRIEDHPHYPWRGMMLDVSRHFFSMAYLRKYIDMMVLYKLNKLHLHLTDDQGWRIEIKKYLRLTSEGAWRTLNDQDSICMATAEKTDNPDMQIDPAHIRTIGGKQKYGGFYTQEEMRQLIRYAAERHVEIIPEIDMPGHMMAAIALYPELTCDGLKGEDWTQGFSTPVCPCRENVLEFAKDIFTEIAALFPSKYIHIGGDEVERSFWKKSPVCAEFMKAHHIETLPQLQSWFNDYMQTFFRTKGKTLMGWDEIVEGGIDSSAAVMFWRTWAGTMPAKATANGNKVVMTADGPLYFDAAQDRNSLPEVYHYDPVDAKYGMGLRQQQNILGVQANLWTEWIPTEARADYMIMPRMSALAELGWTHKDLYEDYLKRLTIQYERLDRLKIHYRLPDLSAVADTRVFVDTAMLLVEAPLKGMTVRYTLDGSWPNLQSPVMDRPVRIDHSLTMRMAAFTASGRRGDVSTTVFSRQDYAKPIAGAGAAAGLLCGIYMGAFGHVADIKGAADKTFVTNEIGLPSGMPTAGFGLKFTGIIKVPETGIYSFYLSSDDGSQLHIAGRLVVDNDGAHSAKEKVGQAALEKGAHAFVLDYFDGGGGSSLELLYSVDGGTPRPVPADWFGHGEGTHVTKRDGHPRIVNIVNFIRWVEPRDPAITHEVLYQTVVQQIALMKANRLGGTFLLQYDALIDPAYQQLLKGLNRDSFEVGGWWEIPQQLVEKAGLVWRGRTSWDWRADVGFAAGYSLEDRKKLVDVYMEDFKKVFGVYPASVGSWYIDAYTLDYMYSRYGIRASCNCKDQMGTDGYTLWGGYWNQAYYPSKVSAYMPAQHAEKQIPVPVFRMLGSDPLRQYENGLGGEHQGVVTLEPVYRDAGGDSTWVTWFLQQLVEGACMEYGYTQAGQENSFTWEAMRKGLELQFPLMARLRDEGKLRIETLEASGKWFKERYPLTPATAVTVNKDLPGQDRKTVWFDSRWYRANLVWDKGHLRWRDVHLFDEDLTGDWPAANPSTVSIISTLPVVDGYAWGDKEGAAGLRLMGKSGELRGGDPVVSDTAAGELSIRWPLEDGGAILMKLKEREMTIRAEGAVPAGWHLSLATAAAAAGKLPFKNVRKHRLDCHYHGRDYSVKAVKGSFSEAGGGWELAPEQGEIVLDLGR